MKLVSELQSLCVDDHQGNDKIDVARLKVIYRNKKLRTPQEQEKEIRDAFKALDSANNGKIQEPELRQILGNLGDALTTPEVNLLMREAKVDVTGGVDYNAFIDRLINAYPVGDKL
jgi:Ca2+-binding EF-hand superfamily protein